MPDELKSSVQTNAVTGRSKAGPDLEVFFVNLVRAAAQFEAEEEKTPRLSDADIERADAMADMGARRSWRAGRIATRIALERAGGPSLRRVPFDVEPGGRPLFGGGGPHFSVSHTDGVALIAVSRKAPVGVDIEAKTRALKMSADRRERIIEAATRLAPQDDRLSARSDIDVLVAWVQLEAAAKALGIGIGPLLTEEGVVGGTRGADFKFPTRGLTARILSVGGDHVAAIAAERLPNTLKVEGFPHANIAAFLQGR